MPKTTAKKTNAPSIKKPFPKDTPSETLLVDISAGLSRAATAATLLSNDGRVDTRAQEAFWSISRPSLVIGIRIDEYWYQIIAAYTVEELTHYRDVAIAAAEACEAARENPTADSQVEAYEAHAAANSVLSGMVDKAIT